VDGHYNWIICGCSWWNCGDLQKCLRITGTAGRGKSQKLNIKIMKIGICLANGTSVAYTQSAFALFL